MTKWPSPTRTIAAADAAASCALPHTSSSAAFSSMSCPTASTASVTTAFSPRVTADKTSLARESRSKSKRPMTPMTERRRRRSPSQRQPPLMNRSPSARIAAASCAASGASQLRQSTPFAATRHDDNPSSLDRIRLPTPPSLTLPTPGSRASSRPPGLTSASIASPSLLLDALERLRPNTRTPQLSPAAAFPSRNRPPKSKPPPRFSHSG